MDITDCLWPTRVPIEDERFVSYFLAKVKVVEECWEWQGATKKSGYRGSSGYGFFAYNGKTRLAHRVAYSWWIGPLDPALEIKHLCHVVACVNPEHLEQDIRRNNLMESEGITAKNAQKTECPKGHPYSGINSQGRRICKICGNESLRRSRAKRKEALIQCLSTFADTTQPEE